MITDTIFCPHEHLILDQPVCPVCGWQRPPRLPQGTLLWEPITAPTGIGGPSKESFYRPGVLNGIAVFPLRSGELIAVNQVDGSILWQSEPSPEQFPKQFFSHDDHLLAVVPDNRPLGQAEDGSLASFDLISGKNRSIWKGYGFTMSDPVFSESLIILRTARPKLVALDRRDPAKLFWETPLRTYKAFSPVIAGDLVLAWDGEITKEQMVLKAFQLKDGKPVWQSIINDIDSAPIVVGRSLIYRSQKRVFTAVDIHDGSQQWQQKFARIYSSPSSGNNKIYSVVCGDHANDSPAHYSLVCLNPENGEPEWQVPLGIRAQEIVSQSDGTLLVGMGDATLAICSAQNGEILKQHSFGNETVDRIQTHLVVSDGICWVGTYAGTIAALRVSEQEEILADPKQLLADKDFENAAAAFALKGKLEKSAEIYLKELNQPQKTLVIYEFLNNLQGQAGTLELMGDELSAAKLYEKDGQLKKAAQLFEKADELRSALELYKKLKSKEDVNRLSKVVPLQLNDVEALELEGKLPEAGDAAMAIKEYRKAVDLYERSGEPYQEKTLNALIHLCDVESETWCLERLSALAGRFQRFEIQAKAFEELEKDCEAAEAFLAAAEQMESKNAADHDSIWRLYDQAAKYFDREGMIVKYQKCYSKVILYKKLPWILVGGKTEKAFREMEYNTLFLFVKNVGYGRADDIEIKVIGENFKVDEFSLPEPIKALAVSAERRIELSIRPNKEQIGEDVRFVLEWSWKDKNQVKYQDRTTVKVVVKSQNDNKTGGTPVTINAENVTYVDGKLVHHVGDNIEAGGKKETGDKVEINHEGYSRIVDSDGEGVDISIRTRECPKCGAINDHAIGYCDKCGSKLE